jgi:biopolymer transport protein ExbB
VLIELPFELNQLLEKIMKLHIHLRAAITALLVTLAVAVPQSALALDAAPVQAVEATPVQAPAPAAAETVVKETVDNPYGLEALWREGDNISKATLIILFFMSIGSWYIIFTKLYEQFQLSKQAKATNETFWTAGGVHQAIETLEVGSPFHFIAKSADEAISHHEGLLAHIGLNAWITQSIQRSIDNVQSRLQDGLAFLATVGATAPFIGLFGTVWGIYHALTAIGIAGQASIDKVAGPVGEALIMTAIGLFVAVPAVLGYNLLVRRNKSELEKVRSFGADLHAVLLGEASAVKVAEAEAEAVRLSPSPRVKVVG